MVGRSQVAQLHKQVGELDYVGHHFVTLPTQPGSLVEILPYPLLIGALKDHYSPESWQVVNTEYLHFWGWGMHCIMQHTMQGMQGMKPDLIF